MMMDNTTGTEKGSTEVFPRHAKVGDERWLVESCMYIMFLINLILKFK